MKISVNAPSYKRSGAVDTLEYIPYCKIWVDYKEFDEYKTNYPDAEIVCCPEGIQGNLCRVRNYILDTEYKNGADVVIIVDDDMQYMGYFENDEIHKMKTEELSDFFYKYSILADDWGAKLWGVSLNPDRQYYNEFAPFGTVNYIGGPFMAHIKSEIRFDERLPLKEDYDMTIQHLNKNRIALKVNKFFYNVKQAEQPGGCAVGRNMATEMDQFILLQKKWGSKIVRKDTAKSRSHGTVKIQKQDINPIIRVPIKGI